MSAELNIIGNLVADPEKRDLPGGVKLASFRLAVNKTWKGNNGEKHEKVFYYKATAWRKQAELVMDYLTKGQQVRVVLVDVEAESWTDKKSGETRASVVGTVEKIEFLRGGKGRREDGGVGEEYADSSAGLPEDGVDLNQIPF